MTAARIARIPLIAVLMLAMSSSGWAAVTSMQMVAPNVGWATTGESSGLDKSNLFWTTDGGVHWREITPRLLPNGESWKARSYGLGGPEPESMDDIFFLDTHRGWVLFCCGYTDSKDPNLAIQYDLAKTTDAGATWSIARVNIPPDANYYNSGDANGGTIEFADSLHGWVTLTSCGGHTCGGPLLATSNGGRTWRATNGGGGEPLSPVTPTFGWSVEIPNGWVGDDESSLSVTRDGAKSWQQVSVPFPREMISASDARQLTRTPFYHDLPEFKDSKHGFLPVTYLAQQADGNSAIVLFETTDAGRTWNPIRALTKLYIPGREATYAVAVAGSTLIATTSSRDNRRVILSRVGPEGRTDIDISDYIGGWTGITHLRLSFATPEQGWMLGGGKLLSTTDSAATWTTLVPKAEQTTSTSPQQQPMKVDSMQLLSSEIGWTLVEGKLYWTESAGTDWKDISPPDITLGEISSVFFLEAGLGVGLRRQQRWMVAPPVNFLDDRRGNELVNNPRHDP